MAILAGEVQFTGTMGGFSAYRMKGSDKIVIRRKGGPGREQVKRHRNFEITRKQNEEWKGCVMACKNLSDSFFPIKHLSDHNFSAPLTGVCKSIQKDDTIHPLGQRSILLSQYAYKIEGFSLNKYNSFESIVRHPLQYETDRHHGTAWVQLPELVPGINLGNPMKQPLYRMVITLGAVADIHYHSTRNRYEPVTDTIIHPVTSSTDWCSYKQTTPATLLTLALNTLPVPPLMCMVLAVGIEFGVPVSNTEIRPAKYAGAGKVVKVS